MEVFMKHLISLFILVSLYASLGNARGLVKSDSCSTSHNYSNSNPVVCFVQIEGQNKNSQFISVDLRNNSEVTLWVLNKKSLAVTSSGNLVWNLELYKIGWIQGNEYKPYSGKLVFETSAILETSAKGYPLTFKSEIHGTPVHVNRFVNTKF